MALPEMRVKSPLERPAREKLLGYPNDAMSSAPTRCRRIFMLNSLWNLRRRTRRLATIGRTTQPLRAWSLDQLEEHSADKRE